MIQGEAPLLFARIGERRPSRAVFLFVPLSAVLRRLAVRAQAAQREVVERIIKSENGLQRDTLMPVRFVPLVTGALPVLGQG